MRRRCPRTGLCVHFGKALVGVGSELRGIAIRLVRFVLHESDALIGEVKGMTGRRRDESVLDHERQEDAYLRFAEVGEGGICRGKFEVWGSVGAMKDGAGFVDGEGCVMRVKACDCRNNFQDDKTERFRREGAGVAARVIGKDGVTEVAVTTAAKQFVFAASEILEYEFCATF